MVSKHSCRLAQTVTVGNSYWENVFTKIYGISMKNSIKIVFNSTFFIFIWYQLSYSHELFMNIMCVPCKINFVWTTAAASNSVPFVIGIIINKTLWEMFIVRWNKAPLILNSPRFKCHFKLPRALNKRGHQPSK